MFEEALDGRVARKSFEERPAGLGILLTRLEEGLEQHQIRHEVDQGVSREVLTGPPVPELALVAGEDRRGEILSGMCLVGPRGGQATRLQRVTYALPAYRVDHAAGVSDRHQPLVVAFRAPHPHLERPARRWIFWRGVLQPAGQLRIFEKAVIEILEVSARAGERCCRDACTDVRPSVSEVEHPAVARAVRVHVLRDKDVQILLIRTIHAAEILPAGDGILVGLHSFAREAPDAVGHDYQRGFEAQRVAPVGRFEATHAPRRRPYEIRGPDAGTEMGARGDRTLEEPGVGLLALCNVAPRTMQSGRDALAQVGGAGVYGEARELAVVR